MVKILPLLCGIVIGIIIGFIIGTVFGFMKTEQQTQQIIELSHDLYSNESKLYTTMSFLNLTIWNTHQGKNCGSFIRYPGMSLHENNLTYIINETEVSINSDCN